MLRFEMKLAPDGAGSADQSFLPELDDPNVQTFRDIQTQEEDVEYVVEGSPEAEELLKQQTSEPEEFKGKTREEILAELAKTREAMTNASKSSEPVTALQATMAQMLGAMQPPKPVVQPGYAAVPQIQKRMGDAEFEKYINELMLENPYKAQMEMQSRIMEPVLQTFAVNQAQMSRELVLANPESKKIYDKYSAEVENAVAAIPVEQRLRNPKVYQQALDMVKAAHMDDFVQETLNTKFQEMLDAKLKELGIDPAKPAASAKPTYQAPTATMRPGQGQPGASIKRIAIPKWVEDEAFRKGLDKGFLYEKYRKEGRVK